MDILIISLALALGFAISVFVKKEKQFRELENSFKEFATVVGTFSQDEVQQNFLKFVSDSREQAFEYIEQTQGELKLIVDSMVDNVAHIHTKKRVSETDKAFLDVYYRLVNLLPDDTQDTV